MVERILENGEVIWQTPWYLTYGFINIWQATLIGITFLFLFDKAMKQNWRKISMETWDYAKTAVLYLEHIALIAAGFMASILYRYKKTRQLQSTIDKQQLVIDNQKKSLHKYLEVELKEEQLRMKKERQESEKERMKTNTPESLLNIAKLFGTEYIKGHFPSKSIIR